MTEEILATALAWHDAGFCVLPARADGSKAPGVSTWMKYQHETPPRQLVEAWFSVDREGIGLVCGAISGNLEMLELEGRAVAGGALADLAALIESTGLADLWIRVTDSGYAERTPSGGLHLLYRVDGIEVPGNTKLAGRAATAGELAANPKQKVLGLAETRGEGGYVVVAPSAGPTHPSGKPWTLAYGRAGHVATITAAERDHLHRLFRTLDRMPEPAAAELPRPLQLVRADGDVRPGDDFEARTPWDDPLLLGGAGWTAVFRRGTTVHWRRPGKDTPGISATTGRDPARDRLYVFSSSTEFDTEVPYTKFGAYTVLHHGGDHSAAGRELARLGYGVRQTDQQIERDAFVDLLPPGTDRRLEVVDGTAARVLAEPAPSPARFGATQDGMALAFADRHQHELRYCPQRGRWLRWEGHRWAWDDAEAHRELARALARDLPEAEGWKEFRRSCLSATGVAGITRLAQSDPRIVAHLDTLDADPWALNTPGGIINLRTGTTRPSEPGALCTRSTPVGADPGADPGRWHEFLADTFGDDPDLIGYLRRLVGYSAVGIVGAHVLPFAHGSGGNGKGVFLEALAGVLGDYATTAPNGFLMAQHFAGHDTEIARLAGARMVICSEVNEEDRFDEAKVKMLTGGDSLTARFMRQDYFTFPPTHQLWLMGNHQPAVRAGGRSFWRRLRLIPFEHEVPDEKVVEDLQGILVRDHGPALLAWIVAGAVAYAEGGLKDPEKVRAATAEYAHDQDSVARFLEDCGHFGGGDQVATRVTRVREAYESFCAGEGLRPVTAKKFGMEMERSGATLVRTRTARMYANFALLVEDNASHDPSDGNWP